ncbi:MAG: hypothetical protein ACR2JA_14965 [Hydrogenophaga sp.]|uniref:hypothetical protein n=1 Tax=Hydrogenophaga sp. TaxID=1904254 RepID=UPI003D9AE180
MNPTESTPQRLQYGERPTYPGMYLGLFHGRNNRKENMDDWGFAGPVLGPLIYCHTTYMAHVHLYFVNSQDARACCNSGHLAVNLEVVEDMIHFEGAYYGDWTVFYVSPEECRRPDDAFRKKPRINMHQWHDYLKSVPNPDEP